ncbi:MAG: DUF2313 domain-containing protein [Clostridiales bacterium]|nr:DUF2313 domain-containing protein [Clostridiales bacterium]
MLDLINKIYRKDNVTIDLINVLNEKLLDIENKTDDIYQQIFLGYATWYLELKEKEMLISKRLDDIDKRRQYVKTRLMGTGTATKEMLESVANSVTGVDCQILFQDMTVIIDFLWVKENKYLGLVKRAVQNTMPYHLDIDIKYDHVTWGEVRGVTWGTLSKYTWDTISKSVSGTIIDNLDTDFD